VNPLLPGSVPFVAAPLDPTPDEARGWLRDELLKPAYHQENVLQQLRNWFSDLFDRTSRAAASTPPLVDAAALLIFALLVVGLIWLLSRVRVSRRARSEAGPVLEESGVSAAELRRRAEEALGAGRYAEAAIGAFRALVVRQIERGRLDDLPGMTAHEVALALDGTFPDRRERIDEAGRIFDLVRYGRRTPTAEQVRQVLDLDDDLAGLVRR
jgi:hypothetical protein